MVKGGPQTYQILKFFVGSFGLDYIVLTDGRRVRNSGLTLLVIIGGPEHRDTRRGGGRPPTGYLCHRREDKYHSVSISPLHAL